MKFPLFLFSIALLTECFLLSEFERSLARFSQSFFKLRPRLCFLLLLPHFLPPGNYPLLVSAEGGGLLWPRTEGEQEGKGHLSRQPFERISVKKIGHYSVFDRTIWSSTLGPETSHYFQKEILTLCFFGTNLDPLREGRGNPGKGERTGVDSL